MIFLWKLLSTEPSTAFLLHFTLWGIEPEGLGTSSSYMAVHVLKDAIERAGTLDSDKMFDVGCLMFDV